MKTRKNLFISISSNLTTTTEFLETVICGTSVPRPLRVPTARSYSAKGFYCTKFLELTQLNDIQFHRHLLFLTLLRHNRDDMILIIKLTIYSMYTPNSKIEI